MRGPFLSARPRAMVIFSAFVVLASPSCGSESFVLGDLGTVVLAPGGGAQGGGAPFDGCAALSASCEGHSDCCSGSCSAGSCAVRVPACGAEGDACETLLDCCSLGCRAGKCAEACTQDTEVCDENEECCSGLCAEGSCASVSQICDTSGNECSQNEECCSGLCTNGICNPASSYCAQTGDTCAVATDCCSQDCSPVEGGLLGTCEAPPSGQTNCSGGIAGSLCDGCNDCCSRLCVPFGTMGLGVCSLAQGCRQTGELCASDLDCCGGDAGSGLPGAGNVTCNKDEGDDFGVCRNALSCSPQGNACHIQNYECGVSAAASKCCSSDGAEGVCLLDGDGIPRCNGLGSSCVLEGDSCAISDDCCVGSCLPNESGLLRCSERTACLIEAERCTATSECCPGTECIATTSRSFGSCVVTPGSVACGLIGQSCGVDQADCCGGTVCSGGRCVAALEALP